MFRIASLSVLAALAVPISAQDAEYADHDFRVSDIEARFLYEQTGSLSVDITDNPDFTAFNTIIGAGDAQENANDLLVTAIIQGPGQHNLTAPLTITARDEQGRLLGTRRMANLLVEARTYRSVLLHDVACAGVIRLTAQLGASSRSEEITLACGE